MEKISQIVRPNARVASVDLKSSGGARPGAPGFGRPAGEAKVSGPKEHSTAERATSLATEQADLRRSSQDRIIDQLANDFFVGKMKFDETVVAGAAKPEVNPSSIRDAVADLRPPGGYVPRGSLVNVIA